MYASIRRYKTDPGSVAEVIERAHDGFVPIIMKAPGFRVYYVVDAGDGVIASVSVFGGQVGAEESNIMAADWVKTNLRSLLPDAPEITAGGVWVFARAAS